MCWKQQQTIIYRINNKVPPHSPGDCTQHLRIDHCVCSRSVAQSCLTLCDPTDCSPLGSPVHKILQVRILEWVAISGYNGKEYEKERIAVRSLSRVRLFATPWTAARQASLSFGISQFAQTHFHRVDDATQPSHPLSLCSLLFLPSVFPSNRVFSNESAHYNGKEYEKECGYMLKKSWIHLEREFPFKGVSMLPEKVLSPVNP